MREATNDLSILCHGQSTGAANVSRPTSVAQLSESRDRKSGVFYNQRTEWQQLHMSQLFGVCTLAKKSSFANMVYSHYQPFKSGDSHHHFLSLCRNVLKYVSNCFLRVTLMHAKFVYRCQEGREKEEGGWVGRKRREEEKVHCWSEDEAVRERTEHCKIKSPALHAHWCFLGLT